MQERGLTSRSPRSARLAAPARVSGALASQNAPRCILASSYIYIYISSLFRAQSKNRDLSSTMTVSKNWRPSTKNPFFFQFHMRMLLNKRVKTAFLFAFDLKAKKPRWMVTFIAYDIPWVRVGGVLDLFSFPVPFPLDLSLAARLTLLLLLLTLLLLLL